MPELIRRFRWSGEAAAAEPLLTREWLVTNGLGGYACGTIAGVATRRFHGLLIAAQPAPIGRLMMLNHLAEQVRLAGGEWVHLGGEERLDSLDLPGAHHLVEFRLENGLPVWHYRVGDHLIEKRVYVPHLQNSVFISYRLLQGAGPVRLRLRPAVQFRRHEGPVGAPFERPYVLATWEDRFELSAGPDWPTLRLRLEGQFATMTVAGRRVPNLFYRVEASRGYDHRGDLWSPGRFGVDLTLDQPATLIASTEDWETVGAVDPAQAWDAEQDRRRRLIALADAADATVAELVLAADQFIISPLGRPVDVARAQAVGEDVRSVIAGYHWFTDWGRDTMISLPGLTLSTGRQADAGHILRTFSHYIRDGLLPNLFPEGESAGQYHTADATLWFFQAIAHYLEATSDRVMLRWILPKLQDIVAHHVRGTHFGIGVDPADGLLRQGAEGYQLTWMDAKVDGWVVTPRRGKAVEINALWYNALRLLADWLRDEDAPAEAAALTARADQVARSFNLRFWYEAGGHLYDVVDTPEGGDDPACRPNQVFAISLTYPVLAADRWEPVLRVVQDQLLTPVGLRSLAPGHPDYQPYYRGDLRSRDAAYHQGTVWGWLIGPFVDAWLRVYPDDRAGARSFLDGLVAHLDDACIGSISEIFDAEAPYTPRGCVAQAWSVAEVLRAWLRTAKPATPSDNFLSRPGI